MSSMIHIFSDASNHSTVRYFERAVQIAFGNASLTCWSQTPNIRELKADDVLFFVDPTPDWPLGLESVPCLTIMYFIDVHQDIDSRLRMSHFFDIVFVAQKDYVTKFHEIGHKNVYWLPLACDPAIHHVPAQSRPIDLGFVGKLGTPNSPRHKILTTALPLYHTNNYSLFYSPSEMAKIYGQSKIVFNASINGDLNMRFFEALASGALLITDRIENGLNELFQDGVHFVGYSTIEEAIKKIDYYLATPLEREIIAREGQRVAFEHHTYLRRWEDITKTALGMFGQAPARTFSKNTLGDIYSGIFESLRLPDRIPEVVRKYGLSKSIMRNQLKAWGRWLNSRIPITPNALRIRFGINK